MDTRLLGRFVLSALLLWVGVGGSRPAAHAGEARYVAAVALCQATTASGPPSVTVQIANHTGLRQYVAYAHSLATARDLQGGLAGLRLVDPGPEQTVPIADGVTATMAAPWAGGPGHPTWDVIALVVTSAGIMLVGCNQSQPARVDLTDPLPTVAGEEAGESARIAAQTIGYLEAWRAYPVLYALLHSDAKAAVSFGQMACWYAAQYGPPVTRDVRTIYSTEVIGITFGDWTWGVNGKAYPKVAEVRYRQTSGVFPKADPPVDATEHLVRVDGIWTWFFGASRDALAGLHGDCNLPELT